MISLTCGERAVGKKRTLKGSRGSFGEIFWSFSKRGLTGKPVIWIFSFGMFLVSSPSRVCLSVIRKWSLGERVHAALISIESVMMVMMGTRRLLANFRSTM